MTRQPILNHLYHILEQQVISKLGQDATINQTTQTSGRGFDPDSKRHFAPSDSIHPFVFEIRIDALQTGFLIYSP